MGKTLIVQYTPREGSHTQKLLAKAKENIPSDEKVETIDLSTAKIPTLQETPLNAYVKRGFAGMDISEQEQKSVKEIDQLCEQLLSANTIIMAFPIYNYGQPAPVKAWIDAVIQVGKTFKYGAGGPEPQLTDKKAIVLTVSGAPVEFEANKAAHEIANYQLKFVGIQAKSIALGGSNMPGFEEKLNHALEQVEQVTKKIYE